MTKLLEPTESQLELQLLHYLVWVKHWFAWKNPTTGFFDVRTKRFRKHVNPYAINGCPDIVCIWKGKFVGFEVKRKKGKQSEAQLDFEKRCKQVGGLYFVIRNLEELQAAISSIENS